MVTNNGKYLQRSDNNIYKNLKSYSKIINRILKRKLLFTTCISLALGLVSANPSMADTNGLNPLQRIKLQNLRTKLIKQDVKKPNRVLTGAAAEVLVPTLDVLHTQDPVAYPQASEYHYQYNSDNNNYELDLEPSKMSDTPNVEWTKTTTGETKNFTYNPITGKGNGTVKADVSYDNTNAIEYYTYNYTVPNAYTKHTDRIIGLTQDIINEYFEGINGTGSYKGASIFENGNGNYNIYADFINNTASGDMGIISIDGGKINTISGNFINNSSGSGTAVAMINKAKAGTITGNFINNITTVNDGGAISIWQNSHAETITGKFIGNTAIRHGGAINLGNAYVGSCDKINGLFVANHAYNQGGAVNAGNKNSSLGLLTGNFINNTATKGGAIYFNSKIDTIIGDFINNNAETNGGAIYNSGKINLIQGNFIGNYLKTNTSNKAYGGAIYNGGISSNKPAYDANSVLTLSDSTFTNNYVNNKGVITPNGVYNAGIINIADNATVTVNDGWQSHNNAKLNLRENSTLNLNIANNNLQTESLGNISNSGSINAVLDIDINQQKADTISVISSTQDSVINIKSLNFINGSAQDIINNDLKIKILEYSTDDNKLQLSIDDNIKSQTTPKTISESYVTTVEGLSNNVNWADNYTQTKTTTTVKGVLDTATTDTLNDSIGVKVTNIETETSLGKIDTLKAVNTLETTANRTFTAANSEEIFTVSDIIGTTSSGKLAVQGKTSLIIDDNGNEVIQRSTVNFAKTDEETDITTNYSGFVLDNNNTELVLKNVEIKGSSYLISGNATNTNIVLDNVNIHDNGNGISTFGDIDIKGNSTISDDIAVYGASSKVNVDGSDEVTLNANLTGSGASTLSISNGKVNLGSNSRISAFNTDINNTNLNIANENSLSGLNTTFVGVNNLNIANGSIGHLSFNNVNLNGKLNMQVDADLANSTMDKLTASNAIVGTNGEINVTHINLISPTAQKTLTLQFTDNTNLANAISYTKNTQIAYSPIYKYNVNYKANEDGGYFTFTTPSASGQAGGYNDFNPAVVANPIAVQTGTKATLNYTFSYAFQQSDTFTKMPAMDRFMAMNSNRFAINDTRTNKGGTSTDFNQNIYVGCPYHENSAVWFRPYAVFESIPFKNGPKVKTISYGTLIGFDTDFKHLKHGWHSVTSGYIGYNGAQVDTADVNTSLNGGLLGITETFYKKNFWTAITATTGANVAENHTMFGHDTSTSLMAGVGSKTGYNFEFKEGKFIIQPIWFMTYSMVNTFDFTNAAGVRIKTKPVHSIQLNPTIRFIGNIKGWQPYASIGMVWSIMDETDGTANGVKLPEMHVKPFVQYGIGLQRTFGERFTGFLQAMVHNGGRNGISLTGGFRWALGDDSHEHEKVHKPNDELKVKNEKLGKLKPSKTNKSQISWFSKTKFGQKIANLFGKMNGEML